MIDKKFLAGILSILAISGFAFALSVEDQLQACADILQPLIDNPSLNYVDVIDDYVTCRENVDDTENLNNTFTTHRQLGAILTAWEGTLEELDIALKDACENGVTDHDINAFRYYSKISDWYANKPIFKCSAYVLSSTTELVGSRETHDFWKVGGSNWDYKYSEYSRHGKCTWYTLSNEFTCIPEPHYDTDMEATFQVTP